ncbi:MAG: helix-turn-helix transcriptional regulator [Gaiellaceae bacterium]
MNRPIQLQVHAADPISQAGIEAALRTRTEVQLVDPGEVADVAVVGADEVDDDTVRVVKGALRTGCGRAVLVVTRIDDAGLLAAVEAGACGLLRRTDATPLALVGAVRAASLGNGTVPPDLLGRLLGQIGRLQQHVLGPRGLTLAGLSEREISVLRLVADGYDTGEIARNLCYSERTIKNVIHDITSRLHLRNRSQAVAYAVREGLI